MNPWASCAQTAMIKQLMIKRNLNLNYAEHFNNIFYSERNHHAVQKMWAYLFQIHWNDLPYHWAIRLIYWRFFLSWNQLHYIISLVYLTQIHEDIFLGRGLKAVSHCTRRQAFMMRKNKKKTFTTKVSADFSQQGQLNAKINRNISFEVILKTVWEHKSRETYNAKKISK